MSTCRRCGTPIRSEYLFCYDCNKTAKTYKDENGYVRFKHTDMPLHRYVAEKKLGRELRPGEVVHHKDRNKANNSMNNLWVFRNREEHNGVYEQDAYYHGRRASYQGFRRKRRGYSDN